jgi:DNA-binding NarL/FixJ family response regulator
MPVEAQRLLLIENEAGMIRSVREALEDQPRFRFVGYLTSRGGLAEFLESHAPDIALVDLGLMRQGEGIGLRPQLQSVEEGLEVIRLISELSPHTTIVGFSNYFVIFPELAKQAMTFGADALIAKQDGPSDWDAWKQWLIAQLHSIVDGWWRPTPEVAELITREEERRIADRPGEPPPLTGRQMEVLKLMAKGYIDAKIADELCIEEGAVRVHIANIRRRLQLRYRWQIIDEARRRGYGKETDADAGEGGPSA